MLGNVKSLVLILALVASLILNVATVTVQSVAVGVSTVIGAVAGASAVLPELRMVLHKGQKKLLSEAVKTTTQRIARRTAIDATRNVTSTFGEAVPAVGVAVIVGVSAWELKDACDTMSDLHDLDVAIDPSLANDPSVSEVCGLKVPTKEEIWAKVSASPEEAWNGAKALMPELPEMPELPAIPDVDWTFWE
jgi:hypothetical protein